MPVDMNQARTLVDIETKMKAAVKTINDCSAALTKFGMDISVKGWCWDRPGEIVAISVQNSLSAAIVDDKDRK